MKRIYVAWFIINEKVKITIMQRHNLKIAIALIILFIQMTPIAHVHAQEGARQHQHDSAMRENYGAVKPDFNKQRLKEELMSLPLEERAARLQELKAAHLQRCEAREKKLEEKWQNAGSEERAYFCQKLQQKCQQENKKFVCDLARDKCGI